jgi:hypothetical protein
MTNDRLTTILDAYGADPDRWPAAERADALALVARSAEARARVAAAARLDGVLDALPPAAPPSRALRARLARGSAPRRVGRRIAPLLVPLAAAAVLALWLERPSAPPPATHLEVPMAQLGVYETPTDSLLTLDDLDWDPTVASTLWRTYA